MKKLTDFAAEQAARRRFESMNYSQQRKHCYAMVGQRVQVDSRRNGILVRTLTRMAHANPWGNTDHGRRERARRLTKPGTPERRAALDAARQEALNAD